PRDPLRPPLPRRPPRRPRRLRGRLLRVRAGLHGLRRRLPLRAAARHAPAVHPARPRLRRRLHRHRPHPLPPDRAAVRARPPAGRGPPDGLPAVRRGVREARGQARALPDLRRGLPPLRAVVRPAPQRDASGLDPRLRRREGAPIGAPPDPPRNDAKTPMSYGRFFAMIITATAVMFGLMYSTAYRLDH